ncbi:hypothetical protein [Prosthecomicrobium pneumaticum]|uniref:Uncharacterized protein n=1 Tax=Prosthecomicrobium pneumaticum TaxID=81895 RepID=A0A7W9FJI7_9HYPH|nr:hypothetical protein [Prosthecomicrobium pneumaticum]MBB5751540.1 hypothetical protein [Prosthecomicrobium pneumaticum]
MTGEAGKDASASSARRVKGDAKGQFARPDQADPNPGGAASADPAVLGGDGEETASDWDAGAENQSDPSLPKRWK